MAYCEVNYSCIQLENNLNHFFLFVRIIYDDTYQQAVSIANYWRGSLKFTQTLAYNINVFCFGINREIKYPRNFILYPFSGIYTLPRVNAHTPVALLALFFTFSVDSMRLEHLKV